MFLKKIFYLPMQAILIGTLTIGVSMTANASLHAPVGGLVYDDVQKIYWLQDANLAATNTFGVANIDGNGGMSWETANQWIAAMNAAKYLGYDDWRLPTSINHDGTGPCVGYSCSDSEMGHLHLIDEISYLSPSFFSNVSFLEYWSSTKLPTDSSLAWTFSFNTSLQSENYETGTTFRAWAIRPVSEVPEPTNYMLLLAGLCVIAFTASKRNLSCLANVLSGTDQ